MSTILGISALHHDAAAALVVDGVPVAAIQEERLSGAKNDPRLPVRAMRGCFAAAGVDPRSVDAVVYYENPYARFARVLRGAYARGFGGISGFGRALEAVLGEKLWVLDAIADASGVDRSKVSHVEHHLAHAASAFFASPYERAAILTIDAFGENVTTSMHRADRGAITPIERVELPHSLGLVYAAITAYLGFEVNEGETKVMGLAGYGTPSFGAEFERIVRVDRDGTFAIDPRFVALTNDADVGFTPALVAMFGPSRSRVTPWRLDAPDDARFADIAASLQDVTERALVALARRAREKTGEDALCLAGGVALNCVANARIARESGFARVFVQPAAGDAGGALGAAYLGALAAGDAPQPSPVGPFLGVPVDVDALVARARAMGFDTTRLGDPSLELARRIARGEIFGLVNGRHEWGPRALGHRSLVASARLESSRARIASAVKKREPFRPFAPAILARAADRYFDGGADDMTGTMTTTRRARPEQATASAAATHVDGTARVQTVDDDGSEFASLLRAMETETGDPIVLNTSLNAPGDPMVATAAQALGFLASHRVDGLLVADVLVTHR